jgi:ferredoxin
VAFIRRIIRINLPGEPAAAGPNAVKSRPAPIAGAVSAESGSEILSKISKVGESEVFTICGICIDECPVDAISMKVNEAEIDMAECIRCGVCHDVCPQGSVRHDSEKVPDMIEANVEITKRYMTLCAQYLGDAKEKDKCLARMIKHFKREKMVAEKTVEELEKLV